ncbi:hypothetical protein BD780_002953 [Clostridium tetanomorphum]|uniref:DUF4179 domain-containing protein n=2 Tax=Clostridium tetanomorphum TaxID=1553 RepID=A0A923E659_CLOTT|nr:DUF4179 domain-containing protein [Clostridium tetanomorphum]KAJ53705.1 hypothetical protein CTM_00510 [Clostridium tetanomorphum DSM 665]MBC2397217.1 DUF4179 domain-containing protein [Clostridium tetanomorphum]MBP1862432.1 hypothetical protein [Clostridium tetanomorphum]NRS85728.1 hypothetical protein [Clostridium tetanomorphum]NRZ96263.1 hypothetical protein [Clostridium tetanomorphum]
MNNNDFNLEEKDIYKLFNGIKIEESEFNDMNEEVDQIQKERIKKNLNKRVKGKKGSKALKYGSMAAAISVACFIGIKAAPPTFAKNIPVLNSIIQMLKNEDGDHGEYEKYSQIVDKSVTDKGVTLTINEILADESKLVISYTIKSDKKIKDLEVYPLQGFLKINGKNFSGSGVSRGKYIDDYTYVVSEEADIDSFKAPEKFNVDLEVSEIANIKGKWNFDFSVSKEEIAKSSTIIKPNKKVSFPDSNITIDKVVLSPIGTYILINGEFKDKVKNRNIPAGEMFEYNYWVAYDDKGVELIPNGIGAGAADSSKFSSKMAYTKVKDIPKHLTILPLKWTPTGGGGVDENGKEVHYSIEESKKPKEVSKIIDGKYPIEISQGKMGKLIIKEIKTEKDKTIVKFTAEGKAPYTQGTSLSIKDAFGKEVKIKDSDIRKNEEKPNEFTMEFESLDPNKQYRVCTTDFANVEVGEDLKFNIEIK